MSLSASARMEIWLHNIKGELEFEQSQQVFRAVEGLSFDPSPIKWGPRMREALEQDPDTLIDWLCAAGILEPTENGQYRRGEKCQAP